VPPAVWIAALWFLATGLVTQAVAQPAGTPPRPQWQTLRVLKPWTGDLDGMVRRHTIRALVVYSKTFYFVDQGRQLGLSYEGLKIFERDLNRKLKADHAKVRIIFLPVARDELIPALLDGRGDIAVANLTITPERQKHVDFSVEDEDLMEMVNAGLVGLIVVDRHKAEFWQQIFKDIALHPEAAVSAGGEIAWMFRKDSPKLKAAVDEIVRTQAAGTLVGNELIRRYLKSTRLVANATSEDEIRKYHRMVSLFKKYGDQPRWTTSS